MGGSWHELATMQSGGCCCCCRFSPNNWQASFWVALGEKYLAKKEVINIYILVGVPIAQELSSLTTTT